jgi:protein-S-isoprenylcysteine O-methyltransferase Ste14
MAQIAVLLGAVVYVPAMGAIFGWPLERPNLLSILVGLVLMGAGFALDRHVSRLLGRALTPKPTPVTDGGLIQTGAFGWVRHPLYLGVAIIALGWWVIWLTPPGFAAVVAVIVFFDAKAEREEQLLREAYPDYDEYAARVRHRIIPGLV